MPTWPAEQMPELYPAGTAKKVHDEQQAVIDGLNAVVRQHPHAKPDEQRRLVEKWCKQNGYELCDNKEEMVVFVPSSIAPELDNWVEVSWPKERTIDSEWQS